MNKKLSPGALFILCIICFYFGGSLTGSALGIGLSAGGFVCLTASIIKITSLVINKSKNKKRNSPLSLEEVRDVYTIASVKIVEKQAKFLIEQFELDENKLDRIVLLLHGFCFTMLIIRFRARDITPEKSRYIIDKILRNLAKLASANSTSKQQAAYEIINKTIGDAVNKHAGIPADKIIQEYGKYMASIIDAGNMELKAMLMAGIGLTSIAEFMEKYTSELANAINS